ncbi:unnamed protein product [Onchocerca flexuosa]|uniref:Uncharacterized protein n=1 Tax=Onchocerca flexuosa TaxID=387005 RepID=A0A183HRF9_9BILA|nr:unnamed protein product [Onchocerca flexuosa]
MYRYKNKEKEKAQHNSNQHCYYCISESTMLPVAGNCFCSMPGCTSDNKPIGGTTPGKEVGPTEISDVTVGIDCFWML